MYNQKGHADRAGSTNTNIYQNELEPNILFLRAKVTCLLAYQNLKTVKGGKA